MAEDAIIAAANTGETTILKAYLELRNQNNIMEITKLQLFQLHNRYERDRRGFRQFYDGLSGQERQQADAVLGQPQPLQVAAQPQQQRRGN